jgi:3-oxoacyl-[acyl-carrier-protein] synthase III
MAKTRISGVRIAGIAAAVPEGEATRIDDVRVFGEEDARRIFKNTGVKRRRVTHNGLCTSDLCLAAAERLLATLDWGKESIDALVFVSQSPDYLCPATACVLQHRLGLPSSCAAFDVNLGCSGYVYGLFVLGSFFAGGGFRRALLLVGDTASRTSAPLDRSVAPLFGDAGAATALECADAGYAMDFVLGTNGAGARHLMTPAGGFRTPRGPTTAEVTEREGGNRRSDEHTYMNGAEVFTFTLSAIPPLIDETLALREWRRDEVDAYVFHQASTFMLKNLQRACALPAERFVIGLEEYGNTSSASIPLAIVDRLRGRLSTRAEKLVLAGYGVGWSWAAVALELGPCVIPEVVIVPDQPPADPLGDVSDAPAPP